MSELILFVSIFQPFLYSTSTVNFFDSSSYPLRLDNNSHAVLYNPYQHNNMRDHDDQTRVFYQLCSMIINILGSPPLPIPFPTTFIRTSVASSSAGRSPQPPQVSPTAFAALFLGISFALMLFGSAIFVIGLMLMPWVIALVMLFYLAGIVSNLSYLAGAVLCPSTKIVSAWKLS